jgi:HEAT repeats
VEGGDQAGAVTGGSEDSGLGRRLIGLALAGGVLGALFTVAVGALSQLVGVVWPAAGIADPVRGWITAGAWLRLPLAGAGLALLRGLPWAHSTGARLAIVTACVATLVLAARIPIGPPPATTASVPTGARAKSRAILKWSYGSPATVARLVPMSRDPDPRVREQAVLALGVNLIVSDVEHATSERPSRFGGLPVRDSLGARLREVLTGDSVEAVRAEAARALWKAPRTFGTHDAAAETLAAILDRADRPDAVERLAWLALDAAAGAPHPALKAAAARFAATTSDTDLAQAARQAARVDSGGTRRPAL